VGVSGRFIPRIDWNNVGLSEFRASLYLEDEVTHKSYNYLANRFYEALSYQVPTVFTEECRDTIEKSGYSVPEHLIISNSRDIPVLEPTLPDSWFSIAEIEKMKTLTQIKDIVYGVV
jgi:hypothetical protein